MIDHGPWTMNRGHQSSIDFCAQYKYINHLKSDANEEWSQSFAFSQLLIRSTKLFLKQTVIR